MLPEGCIYLLADQLTTMAISPTPQSPHRNQEAITEIIGHSLLSIRESSQATSAADGSSANTNSATNGPSLTGMISWQKFDWKLLECSIWNSQQYIPKCSTIFDAGIDQDPQAVVNRCNIRTPNKI